MNTILKFLAILLLLILCTTVVAEQKSLSPQNQTTKITDNQHFRVSFTSKLEPIVINTMHAWTIYIENNKGQPVLNAEVAVEGGMPEHNHGLPTAPQITKNLGDGCYLLEGMRFHMGGWWTVTVSIIDGNVSDSVTFDLNL